MMRFHVALMLVAGLACESRAAEITTADIVSKTTEATFACLNWQPVGLCFWLRCSYFECSVETSLKIGHYNPDFVVSSYNELGKNPWREMQSLLGDVQEAAANGILGRLIDVPVDSSGNRTEGTQGHRDHKNLIFRETDVIGHPLQLVLSSLAQYLCASQAEPFRPYFLSGLDAWSWRRAIPESLYPASLTPGLREVGNWPINTWGGVYPRTGWSIQAEEPKAAALTAQRAGDIVTRKRQPHVYLPLSDPQSTEQRVWPPDPLTETDASTGTWQMLSPKTDTECAVFGNNDLDGIDSWTSGRVDEQGDYLWNLWRPYQCCEREGQAFLFDINWIDYPQ
jgi:integrating conjugative element protein (TIGR03756 family)